MILNLLPSILCMAKSIFGIFFKNFRKKTSHLDRYSRFEFERFVKDPLVHFVDLGGVKWRKPINHFISYSTKTPPIDTSCVRFFQQYLWCKILKIFLKFLYSFNLYWSLKLMTSLEIVTSSFQKLTYLGCSTKGVCWRIVIHVWLAQSKIGKANMAIRCK